MARWYMTVATPDGQQISAQFYHCDVNPLSEYPERFDHTFIDLPDGDTIFQYVEDTDAIPNEAVRKDDIRYVVDALDTDTAYWIVDAHDTLGAHFPSVPDIPGHSHPSYFVGVPRKAVCEVYSQ